VKRARCGAADPDANERPDLLRHRFGLPSISAHHVDRTTIAISMTTMDNGQFRSSAVTDDINSRTKFFCSSLAKKSCRASRRFR
jgi:hypothetical protein